MELSSSFTIFLLLISIALCSGGKIPKVKGFNFGKGGKNFKPDLDEVLDNVQTGIDLFEQVRPVISQENSGNDNIESEVSENIDDDITPKEDETPVLTQAPETKPTTDIRTAFLELIYEEFQLCYDILDKEETAMNQAREHINTSVSVVFENTLKEFEEKLNSVDRKKISNYMTKLEVITRLVFGMKILVPRTFAEVLDHIDVSRRATAYKFFNFTNRITRNVSFTTKPICTDLQDIGKEAAEIMEAYMKEISRCNQKSLSALYESSSKIEDVLQELSKATNDSYKVVSKCIAGEKCVKLLSEEYGNIKRIGAQAAKELNFGELETTMHNLKEDCVKCFKDVEEQLTTTEEVYIDDIQNCLEING